MIIKVPPFVYVCQGITRGAALASMRRPSQVRFSSVVFCPWGQIPSVRVAESPFTASWSASRDGGDWLASFAIRTLIPTNPINIRSGSVRYTATILLRPTTSVIWPPQMPPPAPGSLILADDHFALGMALKCFRILPHLGQPIEFVTGDSSLSGISLPLPMPI